jgi:hypothetical protein
VDNNYLDLGVHKSGFVYTLPSGRLINKRQKQTEAVQAPSSTARCDAKYH